MFCLHFFQACQISSGMGTIPWCYCCSVGTRYDRDFRHQENRLSTMCCNSYSWSAVSRWQRRRKSFWKSPLLFLCHKGCSQRAWSVLGSQYCSDSEAASCGPECGWRIFCWIWEQTMVRFLPEDALRAWASLEEEYRQQNEFKESVGAAV